MSGPLLMLALGGNALAPADRRADVEDQRRRLAVVSTALAGVTIERPVVITHGNGPQVGQLALDQLAAHREMLDPLDVLDAATEGSLGYLVEVAVRNALQPRPVVSVLTLVEVDPNDPAFADPTKPVGPAYPRRDAKLLAGRWGWTVHQTERGWRRVVPSPEPRRVIEHDAIAALVAQGFVVVCAGGGGIPVVRENGGWRGVEAVIDKDLTTALLATRLHAGSLVLLTDVPGVIVEGFGTPHARSVAHLTVPQARALALPAGAMGTKIEAACRFVEATGRDARIGALDDAAEVIAGRAGTRIHR